MKTIIYTFRGLTERGGDNGYHWTNGFSETTDAGAVVYPWMTARECQVDAAKRGAKAVFQDTKNSIKPNKTCKLKQ